MTPASACLCLCLCLPCCLVPPPSAADVYGNPPAKYAADNGHDVMVHLLQHSHEKGVIAAALFAGKAAAAEADEASADAEEAAEAAELVMRAAAAASGALTGAAPTEEPALSAADAATAEATPDAGAAAATGLRHRGAAAATATEQFVTEPPLPGILGPSSRAAETVAATGSAVTPAKRPGFKLMAVHIVLLALLIGVALPLGAFVALRRAAPDGR